MSGTRRDKAAECRTWNGSVAHQREAGRARAARFTRDHQQRAGLASFAAFSARWRARQGLSPLAAEHVRYLVPSDVRTFTGKVLSVEVQEFVLACWASGSLFSVAACRDEFERRRRLNAGTLWEGQVIEPGAVVSGGRGRGW